MTNKIENRKRAAEKLGLDHDGVAIQLSYDARILYERDEAATLIAREIMKHKGWGCYPAIKKYTEDTIAYWVICDRWEIDIKLVTNFEELDDTIIAAYLYKSDNKEEQNEAF